MVVCLFSACNDDDDDKIPQGPAITYAGKLPSRIGDYTFVYDDNNRCTQVKNNSYVYGEIDYDKGVVIMDDEEAKVSFNTSQASAHPGIIMRMVTAIKVAVRFHFHTTETVS